MEGSTFVVVHVVRVRRDKLNLLAFGQIGGLVQDEAAVPHAGSERLLHRLEVYSVMGSSSKVEAAPLRPISSACSASSAANSSAGQIVVPSLPTTSRTLPRWSHV